LICLKPCADDRATPVQSVGACTTLEGENLSGLKKLPMNQNDHTLISQVENVLIEAALDKVPRAIFVGTDASDLDIAHSTPSRRLARQILYHLDYFPCQTVLHVGSGSGYLSALLAQLSNTVIAIERNPMQIGRAQRGFDQLGIDNVQLVQGDGTKGLLQHAPYNIIVVSTPALTDQSDLFRQLAHDGQLLCMETIQTTRLMLVRYRYDHQGTLVRSELGLIDFSHQQDESLVDLGLISDDVMQQARRLSQQNQTPLMRELRNLVDVEEKVLYQGLATQSSLPLGEVDELLQCARPEVFNAFSRAFLEHHQLMPLAVTDGVLLVATPDPQARLDELEQVYPNTPSKKILVTPTDFKRLWSALERGASAKSFLFHADADDRKRPSEDLLDKAHNELSAHLISLFDSLLLDAAGRRASDIHLELYDGRVRVRLRIDGDLQDLSHYTISAREYRGLINVIKLRAELNIAEKRLPQGGRSSFALGGRRFDLRIHVQPSLHGEHIIIRLLEQTTMRIGIEDIGLGPSVAQHYRRLLDNPAGLVLVVGPTGSGKSTTLYAGLQTLARDATRKVITVEDPIEYSIENIQQTRVRPEIGFSFSDAMRSFVRQDPDVIMVGEIRDRETAIEAIRAAQTGHIVLSTLHSNDAIDALQRLYDLNIEANSISCELLAILAQRLAKKICPKCKVDDTPDPKIMAELFPRRIPENFRCYRGKGCKHCGGSGTKGRIAVVEYLQVNPDIRFAIASQPPIVELRRKALDNGLITMRDSALDHVIQGTIPLSELPRILPQERMAPEIRGGR
jgi:type IV pilus assembly protein PilB